MSVLMVVSVNNVGLSNTLQSRIPISISRGIIKRVLRGLLYLLKELKEKGILLPSAM
jgi:hypothetical protein